MHPFAVLLLAGALAAADWPVPGAVRRWSLTAPAGSAPVGMVRVWPQSAEERDAVAVAGGRPVATRTVWSAPGEPLEVWFDAAARPTHLYLGQLKVGPWEPPAGLWLETRRRPDLPADTAEQLLALWDKAGEPYGRGHAERIWHGGNPYGPSEDFAARFTGWLEVPAAGAWDLATISDDGSMLLLDGRQVVAWPGWHGAEEGARGERHARLQLTAGRHRLDFRWLQGGGGACAALAWRKAGDQAFAIVPAEAFAGCAWWTAGEPATPRGPDWAVQWRTLAHAAPGVDALDPCAVLAQCELAGPPGAARWRFDDGTTGEGRLLDHWFLAPGLRRITVAVTGNGAPAERTVSARLAPAWLQAGPLPEPHAGQWRRQLANRRWATLPPAELAAGVRLALAAEETAPLAALAEPAAARAGELAAADPALALRFALALQGPELRRYPQSAALLAGVATPSARLHLGGMRLAVDGDAVGAEQAWRGLDPARLDDGERRLLGIYRADARALQGDAAGARAAYRALPQVADPASRDYVMRRRLRLELARDRLSQGRWTEAEQALREIEWETPLERLGDETGLLFIRLWLARGELQFARTRASMLLAGEGGTREPEVLLAAARIELAAKDAAAAQRLLDRLRKDHPYSEAAAMAAEIKP